MGKAIQPIKHIIMVTDKKGNIKLYRTLKDALKKVRVRIEGVKYVYHSIARYIKLNGKYEGIKYTIERRPIYGKYNKE